MSRFSRIPIVWALACVIALGSAFYAIPWFVVAYDSLTEANHFAWPEMISNAFGPDVEYRPLFRVALKASYQMFGMHLWPYQTLVLLQFACVLALLIWLCRPVGTPPPVISSKPVMPVGVFGSCFNSMLELSTSATGASVRQRA